MTDSTTTSPVKQKQRRSLLNDYYPLDTSKDAMKPIRRISFSLYVFVFAKDTINKTMASRKQDVPYFGTSGGEMVSKNVHLVKEQVGGGQQLHKIDMHSSCFFLSFLG